MPRILAMLPTWNEAENIEPLLDAILAAAPEMEVLVVDDDSPDGTWRRVARRAHDNPRVHLLHRRHDRGRGRAGLAGFQEALRLGADAVIEMDADWSHDPKWIPSLIEHFRAGADVVVGSRLIPGGGEAGRPWARRLITRAANLYLRTMLRLPVRDATSGYRLFSRRCLEALPWEIMEAQGPEVVQEVLLAAHGRGFRIVETPILFVERRHGVSNFGVGVMIRSLLWTIRLRARAHDLAHWGADRRSAAALRREQLTPLPSPVTIPMSWLYGFGRQLDRARKTLLWSRPRRLHVPVVCVGNLTVGGTGKTPFVAMLARQLNNGRRRPAIISRGFGAVARLDHPLIVSDRERVLAEAEEAGDEPRLLAELCPGVPVVVHPNRARAGRAAIKQTAADLLILDDGFQHDRLRRDLDLVLWDLRDEPRKMRLLPAGRLREGLGALRRAGAIVLTHGETLRPDRRKRRGESVIHQLKRRAPQVPIFEAVTRICGYESVCGRLPAAWTTGAPTPAPDESQTALSMSPTTTRAAAERSWPWSGRPVVAVSALARPSGFELMLRASGARVMAHFAYPDHANYQESQVERWRREIERLGALMIVTTAKDAVKLARLPLFGLTVVAVKIEMAVIDSERWDQFLRERINDFDRREMIRH